MEASNKWGTLGQIMKSLNIQSFKFHFNKHKTSQSQIVKNVKHRQNAWGQMGSILSFQNSDSNRTNFHPLIDIYCNFSGLFN